jgi:hypothetical protein
MPLRRVELPDGPWSLTATPELFATLRRDKEFEFLVAIGRVTTAFKFGITAGHDQEGKTGPRADRQRHGAYLYLAGCLHELFTFMEQSEKQYGGATAYVSIAALLATADIAQQRKTLDALRNCVAFHFDPTIPRRVLPTWPEESIDFVQGRGKTRLGTNYIFADLVTLAFLFGGVQDLKETADRFESLYDALMHTVRDYVRQADRILIARLLARGFRVVEHDVSEDAG